MKTLNNLFTEHPTEVGMSYGEHFLYALTVTRRLFVCFLACFVHAFLPFLFTHTTSETIAALHDEFNQRMIYESEKNRP